MKHNTHAAVRRVAYRSRLHYKLVLIFWSCWPAM